MAIQVLWPTGNTFWPPRGANQNDPPTQTDYHDAYQEWMTKTENFIGLTAAGSFSSIAARLNASAGVVRVGTTVMTFINSSFSEQHTFIGENDFGPGGRYLMVLPIQDTNGVLSVIFAIVNKTFNNITLQAFHNAGPLNDTLNVSYIAVTNR